MESNNQKSTDLIGAGLFGEVKRETVSQGDKKLIRVAKKTLNIKKVSNLINKQVEEYIKKTKERITEISNLVKDNYGNCNITKYYVDSSSTDGKFSFKMELCNYNLSQYLKENYPSKGLDIGEIYDILNQLNNAFKTLGFNDVVHGNIKLENILINLDRDKYTFKLSGLEIIPELINLTINYRPDKICKYLPPEILKENNKASFAIDQKIDSWSLGVIIYYLFFKEFPYNGETFQAVLTEINTNKRKRTNFVELDNLIDGLLNENKDQRLTWEKYLNHPFFTHNGFWKKYIIIKKIGKGEFSVVYEAKNKVNGTSAAIKIIDFSKIQSLDKGQKLLNDINKELKERIKIMGQLFKENPKYFVEIYEEFDIDNGIAFAMELCQCNLKKYINGIPDQKASDIFFFLVEINKSFKFLRSKNISLGNLKLQNILLKEKKNSDNFSYKLTDIGLCQNLLDLEISHSKIKENMVYISPELYKKVIYDNVCDLWSLGIIVHYFRFKHFPFDINSNKEIINQINSSMYVIDKSENPKFNSLIEGLLEKNPKERLNWDKYFHHPFFIDRQYSDYYDLSEKPLSQAGYYSIYEAKERKTGMERIIKIIDKNKIRKKYKRENLKDIDEKDIKKLVKLLAKQTEVMKELEDNGRNKNTVQFFQYFNTQDEFAIVMEKCDTDLSHFLTKRKENYSLDEIKDLLHQINNTFRIMAQNSFIHGDLKLENILMKNENNKYTYKLTDYGVSQEFLRLTEKFLEKNGSPKYTAPEVLNGEEPDTRSDLWSLGILIYTLHFRNEPYDGNNDAEVLENILKNGQNNLKQISNDPQFDHLIRKLLSQNPRDRLSWEEYFDHPFLVKGDCWKYYIDKQWVGEADYYKIYKVKSKKTGEDKAIKAIDLRLIRSKIEIKTHKTCTYEELKEYIDDFITETKNMEICRGTNMDNINTVLFYEYFQTEDEFCIVEELCDKSLMQLILDGKKFSVQEIYQILSQLNNTFKIIKEANLSYRGLRLDKILIKKNEKGEYIYKLNGLSYDKKIYNLLGAVGFMRNEKYKAPELLNNLLISKKMTSNELNLKYQKADIWSLGIIIFILYFGEFPYEGNRAREILSNIRKNENVRLNEINDPELKDLLKKMLTEDKDERIDWDSYFSHKFFSREKWA